MRWVKCLALAACFLTPLSGIIVTAASADPAASSAPAATTDTKPAPAADTSKPAMSDADKRAKAADCSKQADAKHLHGEARKKFRAACKRG